MSGLFCFQKKICQCLLSRIIHGFSDRHYLAEVKVITYSRFKSINKN